MRKIAKFQETLPIHTLLLENTFGKFFVGELFSRCGKKSVARRTEESGGGRIKWADKHKIVHSFQTTSCINEIETDSES